jgi:hypothetical protein
LVFFDKAKLFELKELLCSFKGRSNAVFFGALLAPVRVAQVHANLRFFDNRRFFEKKREAF